MMALSPLLLEREGKGREGLDGVETWKENALD